VKTFDFSGLSVCCGDDEACKKAAKLFFGEIQKRTGILPLLTDTPKPPSVSFVCAPQKNKDSYTISYNGGVLTIAGEGIRSLIYGYSYFLRKSEYRNGKITLIRDISGEYVPDKRIRGHQLGYRNCNNTYDAWSLDDYRRYYLDIMMFGSNTVEQIPGDGGPGNNRLMKYNQNDFCFMSSALADEFDLDFSLWYPNDDKDLDESLKERREFFEKCPRLNVVFPPGGDPGDYPGDEFVDRCIAISKELKKIHPNAEMWPSAQKPHTQISWGEDFIEKMKLLPDEIDGVITGPNRAFTLDTLRRLLPSKYPIRLYPDITHNVRCEYPVHFDRDDWHYALATAIGRETINPRPVEYREIHRLTRRYVVGSVSYSDGSNDDVNKMVWGDMDFFPDTPLRETLLDYARAFMWELPAEKVADGILALERNWIGDPAENPSIEDTYALWKGLSDEYPQVLDNWRFCQLLFRAGCDALVRRRRLFENSLLDDARYILSNGGTIEEAIAMLNTEYEPDYRELRAYTDMLAQRLFDLIGMQLEVERFGASGWERGATLNSLDLPVTDRAWYLNRLNYALTLPENERDEFINGLINRNKVAPDEYYFSLAEHGFGVLGEPQQGEFYIDFQGDRVSVNNGTIPMSQLKLYDHYSFRCRLGGFTPGVDYKLRISYRKAKYDFVRKHTVTVNGKVIYCGKQYGGEKNEKFDADYLAPNTETATYLLPAEVFENGCVELVISEPTVGIMMSEFWVLRA
jgi:hypothetical protein